MRITLDAAYALLDEAQWKTIHMYGSQPSERDLAARVLAHPKLAFFRWFADHPALYRIDRGNPSTCVWFKDLRFADPRPLEHLSLRSLSRARDWRAFQLLDDGTREPVD